MGKQRSQKIHRRKVGREGRYVEKEIRVRVGKITSKQNQMILVQMEYLLNSIEQHSWQCSMNHCW